MATPTLKQEAGGGMPEALGEKAPSRAPAPWMPQRTASLERGQPHPAQRRRSTACGQRHPAVHTVERPSSAVAGRPSRAAPDGRVPTDAWSRAAAMRLAWGGPAWDRGGVVCRCVGGLLRSGAPRVLVHSRDSGGPGSLQRARLRVRSEEGRMAAVGCSRRRRSTPFPGRDPNHKTPKVPSKQKRQS